MAKHNEILAKASLTPGNGATATLEAKAASLARAERITVWVYPTDQAITVTVRTAMPDADTADAVGRQTGNIGGSSPTLAAVAAAAGEWTPITFEHLPIGDLLVDVIAGGTAPTSIETFIAGLVN